MGVVALGRAIGASSIVMMEASAIRGRHSASDSNMEDVMSDYLDNQHGVNDPVSGVDVKPKSHDNKTPHEQAQTAADVRADPSPASEPFLPEALRRPPAGPLNKRTGRNQSE
jgi:hypothetical protein